MSRRKKKIEPEAGFPPLGSEADALGEMPNNYPECPVGLEREALRLARNCIFHIAWNLDRDAKEKSVEHTLAQLGFLVLERLPQLAALAALDGMVLPEASDVA